MKINILKHIAVVIALVLIQVLVLNYFQVGGTVTPYLYILFILSLPASTPRALMLVIGFFLGLTIDIFTNTLGIHASATVFMAFCRPYVLQLIKIKDDTDRVLTPSLSLLGFTEYFTYASILVLLHHVFLFSVESFSFHGYGSTLLRSLMSSAYTLALIFVTQLIFYRKSKH